MGGCSAAAGGLDDSKFAEPLPAVGLYVAGASLLYALAIGLDALRGIRLRRPWFPCKYSSLNSATLTILGIATKFPVDLNTAMPSRTDQLSKLSSTVLICTIMANIAPSLGTMDNPELVSNLIALGIQVVTVVVNVCIQMGTGVIYAFLPEHAVVLLLMLYLLLTLVYTARTVPGVRRFHSSYKDDMPNTDTNSSPTTDELRDCVTKLLLAEDGTNIGGQLEIGLISPVFGTSGLLGLVILLEAFVRSLVSESSMFCKGTSEYKWSVALVLIAQAAAIVLGAVPSASRCLSSGFLAELKVPAIWEQSMILMHKGANIQYGYEGLGGRMKRKLFSNLKGFFLCLLVTMQLISKLVNWLNYKVVFLLSRLLAVLLPLENYLKVEAHLAISVARKDVQRWVLKGRKRKPAELIELIKERHSHFKGGFGGVVVFSSCTNPSYPFTQTPNCWAINIVALAIVAAAVPDVDSASIESLLEGVHQGLRFVRLVDRYLEASWEGYREAADDAWYELDVNNSWRGNDLRHLVPKGSSGKSVVQKLQEIGAGGGIDPLDRCVDRVTTAILQDYDRLSSEASDYNSYPFLPRTDGNLFPWLRMTISDVLRACLTNLPRAIHKKCVSSSMAEENKRAKKVAYMIGQVEDEIIPILVNQEFADLYPNRTESIDGWIKNMLDFPPPIPTSTVNELSAVIIDHIDKKKKPM